MLPNDSLISCDIESVEKYITIQILCIYKKFITQKQQLNIHHEKLQPKVFD